MMWFQRKDVEVEDQCELLEAEIFRKLHPFKNWQERHSAEWVHEMEIVGSHDSYSGA
jgi:hypothetical protein